MAESTLPDIDQLLAPVPGDAPAGQLLPDDIRRKLDDARKEADPLDPAMVGRRADWPGIIKLARGTLTTTSKDLLVAVRLAEALAKEHGFAGLRDGFQVLTRLVEECWDRIHPIPEDADGLEVREGPFKWLNDITRGARFPHSVMGLVLLRPRERGRVIGEFSYLDWVQPARKAELEEAIPKVTAEDVLQTYTEACAARDSLHKLGAALDARLGDASPDLVTAEHPTNVGSALENCISLLEEVMRRRGISPSANNPADPVASPDGAVPATATFPSLGSSRDALYRQVEHIADALQRMEPHSPIPYLLRRAVRLGALPFPELMRAIIRETSTLGELDRLLGLAESESKSG